MIELRTEEERSNTVHVWRLYWFHASDLDANYPADPDSLNKVGYVAEAELETEREGRKRAERDAGRMHYLGNLVRSRSSDEQAELNELMRRYPVQMESDQPRGAPAVAVVTHEVAYQTVMHRVLEAPEYKSAITTLLRYIDQQQAKQEQSEREAAELRGLLLEARDVIARHLAQSTTWGDERHALRRERDTLKTENARLSVELGKALGEAAKFLTFVREHGHRFFSVLHTDCNTANLEHRLKAIGAMAQWQAFRQAATLDHAQREYVPSQAGILDADGRDDASRGADQTRCSDAGLPVSELPPVASDAPGLAQQPDVDAPVAKCRVPNCGDQQLLGSGVGYCERHCDEADSKLGVQTSPFTRVNHHPPPMGEYVEKETPRELLRSARDTAAGIFADGGDPDRPERLGISLRYTQHAILALIQQVEKLIGDRK